MMGLQATTGKRKLESAATAPGESSPAKAGRWEADDCIARLQAVAVPDDAWSGVRTSSSQAAVAAATQAPSLAAALLCAPAAAAAAVVDDFDDDDEFDDDLSSDDDRCGGAPEPTRFAQQQPPYARYHPPPDYWQYYQPPQQQTIRCEENGKSYLELGAAPPPPQPPPPPQLRNVPTPRCCDGRTRWCHVPCYRQRRLAVLNLSMCKLARYRQCSDPSLRRSVLICNTLRRLEREMESEPPPPLPPPPPEPSYAAAQAAPLLHQEAAPLLEQQQQGNCYEQGSLLREMTCQSGRATPFPSATGRDCDSGIGDDDDDEGDGVDDDATRPINWGSVLSLTSQTDLALVDESLNNNGSGGGELLYAELGLSPRDEWKEPTATTSAASRVDNEWDGFMQHVLVGGT